MASIPNSNIPISINVLFDGTGNDATDPNAGAKGDTNVGRMTQLIADKNKLGQPQYWVYYSGLGTTSRTGPWDTNTTWSKLQNIRSVVAGEGILDHVAAAYQFVCDSYAAELSLAVEAESQPTSQDIHVAGANAENAPGKDTINIFGFSRGGATAIFLAQLLFQVGVVKRQGTSYNDFSKQCDEVARQWMSGRGDITSSDALAKIKDNTVKIRARCLNLGLYDPVAAIGIPDQFKVPWKELPWAFTLTLPEDIGFCMIAYAAAEHRNNYKPMILQNVLHSIWFPAYHSSCGGGTKQKNRLTVMCLLWMLSKFENRLDYNFSALEKIIQDQCVEPAPTALTDPKKSFWAIAGDFSRAKAIQEDRGAKKHITADPITFTQMTGITNFPASAAAVFKEAGEQVGVSLLTAFEREWIARFENAGDLEGPANGPNSVAGILGRGVHQKLGPEETFEGAKARRKGGK